MKCAQCGAEIKDGAKYCKACGAKLDIQKETTRFCTACGAPLKPGAAFCTSCGTKAAAKPQQPEEKVGGEQAGTSPTTSAATPPGNISLQQKSTGQADRASAGFTPAAPIEKSSDAQRQAGPPQSLPKKKKYIPVIIAVLVLLCVGIAVAVVLKFTVFDASADQPEAAGDTSSAQTEQQAETVTEMNPDQIDSSNADIMADGEVSMQGTVKVSTDNRLFLDWGEPKSILMKEDDGEFVKLNDVSSAYLENEGVSSSLWNELPLDQTVLVTGELELDGSQLILEAQSMTNPDGTAIVKQVEQAVSAEILPQSDTRLLTQQDVAGLSLREINYAKNEIYARHGRKFASKELQDYFNAQSWYQGTVDAADFQESSLSDIEKKNAEFLAEVEFSIAPNGYQLDQ